jgi:hypothetical protein
VFDLQGNSSQWDQIFLQLRRDIYTDPISMSPQIPPELVGGCPQRRKTVATLGNLIFALQIVNFIPIVLALVSALALSSFKFRGITVEGFDPQGQDYTNMDVFNSNF